MNEFISKKSNNSLFVTQLDEDTPILQFTGDYIVIWEILENNPIISKNGHDDIELQSLEPFLSFLESHNITLGIDKQKKNAILEQISNKLSGTFNIVVLEELSTEYSAWGAPPGGCSPSGTGPYGAEPSCDPYSE